jgi:hypothetical protein
MLNGFAIQGLRLVLSDALHRLKDHIGRKADKLLHTTVPNRCLIPVPPIDQDA